MKESKKCLYCKEVYFRKVCSKQWAKSKYCSRSCKARDRTGEKNSNWKGGVFQRSDGYVCRRIKVFQGKHSGKKYNLEHRLVMAKFLGRELMKTEIIHHKNGDTSDNRIENLEILTQKKHAKEHNKLRTRNKNGQYV